MSTSRKEPSKGARRGAPAWNAAGIRSLRERLGLTQAELAAELGVRQQTVSEWETGRYAPRGAAARLLSIVAERVANPYTPRTGAEPPV